MIMFIFDSPNSFVQAAPYNAKAKKQYAKILSSKKEENMNKKKLLAILCAIAMLVTTIPADTAEAAGKSSKLTLSKTSCVMKKGTKFKLKVTGTLNSFNGKLKWSTSNWKVAVVTPKGVVIARKKGTTVIKVKAGNQKATCKVTVGTPVKKITSSRKSLTLAAGKTAKIKTSISPRTATVKTLKFTSKNKRVATVSKKGIIKGIAAGTTQIAVESTDGSKKRSKVKVKVQGKKKKHPPINLAVKPIINVSLPTPAAGQITVPTSPSKETPAPTKMSGTTDAPNFTETSAPGQTATAAPVPDYSVRATGISLSDAEKELNINEKAQLTASVSPTNATDKTVTWSSSNEEIATVNKTGMVIPEGEGEAEITAATADGKYSATCTVTVTPTAVVSTDKEIAYALSKKNLKRLEVDSTRARKLTVPEGTYSNVDMVINLPNGELENNGVFHSITIEEIAQDTYFENAIGNIIKVASKKAHIVIDEKASTSITISKESKDTAIENNGTIKKLEIKTKGKVDITGLSKEKISVDITAEVTISSTLKLNINASSRFNITVRPGAESTEVTVDVEANMPNIFGLGIISIKIKATGEIKNVVGENTGADDLAKTVKITGNVQDVDGKPIEGAEIYIVRYSGEDYDVENIWTDTEAVRLTTNASGEYNTHNKVKAGNYYLAARKNGYLDLTRQIVVITSTYGDTYTNEEITMIPASWKGQTGNVTGKILDSAQKDLALPDIAVRLRKGKGSTDSKIEIEKETRTDADGIYRFDNLEAGYYTIELADDKTQAAGGEAYKTTWINVLIRPGETVTEGAIMSKSLLEKQLRFVLSWGSKESGAVPDLDAHLTGPSARKWDNGRFHTYYQNKTFDNRNEEQPSHADLDVDDVDYEGPETTTIYESAPGVYSYYVHDFTNKDNWDSDKLAGSSVKVEVYIGNLKQHTYYIPQGKGTVWHVFDYDSSTEKFQTVNTMYYEDDSSEVGYTIEQYKSSISSRLTSISNYYKLLEEGTAEDIQAKITSFQKRLDALTEKQEGEAARLLYETRKYDNGLDEYECFPRCNANEILYDSTVGSNGGTQTLYVNNPNFEPTVADFSAGEGGSVTEVASTQKNAWKAFRVVAANGHARVIHIYLTFDLKYAGITKATANGETLSFKRYYNFDGTQEVSSPNGTAFALEDIQFSFNVQPESVTYTPGEIEGTYALTIQLDGQTKTFKIRKKQPPAPSPVLQITDPNNKIYKTERSGSYLYVYADTKTLSEDCIFTVDGRKYTFASFSKKKSEPDCSKYFVGGYYIYCYAADDSLRG